MPTVVSLPDLLIEPTVRHALHEDLGQAGDITTAAVVGSERVASGVVLARETGTVAGLSPARLAFEMLDGGVVCRRCVDDGQYVREGDVVMEVNGPAQAILSAERVALNFLGHLSGIATATNRLSTLTRTYGVGVTCTRKTTPGLRALEKAAVRAGGGVNHRYGLDDAILIKDNHVAAVGGISEALRRARALAGHMVKVQIEVDTLAQLEEAMAQAPDAVLLDNMPLTELRHAVEMLDGKVISEASGGITDLTAAAVAATGVDLISVGWLTHSSPALDVSLDMDTR